MHPRHRAPAVRVGTASAFSVAAIFLYAMPADRSARIRSMIAASPSRSPYGFLPSQRPTAAFKNDGGRTIPLTADLVSVLEALPRTSEYVFLYHGKPIRSIKTAWKSACEAAGMPDLLFHDLRRTGVRNLVRSGVSEHVAMSISGHKTRAVFDRYNIVSEQDQREAVAKLEAAQSILERQAENMLPAKMDKFMVSAEPAEESEEISESAGSSQRTQEISEPQSDPEQK